MAEVTAGAVKSLREKSGAGMVDCKNALVEANGDEAAAIEILRKKGMATAGKKAGRVTAEGAVGSYIHMGGKVGVLVELKQCSIRSVRSGIRRKCYDVALRNPRSLFDCHRFSGQLGADRCREYFCIARVCLCVHSERAMSLLCRASSRGENEAKRECTESFHGNWIKGLTGFLQPRKLLGLF